MGLKSHYPSGTSGLIPFDIPYTYRQRVCLWYWRGIGGNINRVCVNDTKDILYWYSADCSNSYIAESSRGV